MSDDDWEKAYRQHGKAYVEPLEYLPCPGSVRCCQAISKGDDEPEDDGPSYPVETNYP